jgi:hypothetical protein
MNETELLELGPALTRTADVLRPGRIAPFRDYVRVVLADLGVEVETLFGPDASCQVSMARRICLNRREREEDDPRTRLDSATSR